MSTAESSVDNLIRKIDDELFKLHKAPQTKEYSFYDFGTALKCLIEQIQRQGLENNSYYNTKIQEYIAVYKDLFSGTNQKASKVCELLSTHKVKVDYSVFASEGCPDPNIIQSKYDVDKYPDEIDYHKLHRRAYRHLTEHCWNIGHKFQRTRNGYCVIMTFEQYISRVKASRKIGENVQIQTLCPPTPLMNLMPNQCHCLYIQLTQDRHFLPKDTIQQHFNYVFGGGVCPGDFAPLQWNICKQALSELIILLTGQKAVPRAMKKHADGLFVYKGKSIGMLHNPKKGDFSRSSEHGALEAIVEIIKNPPV